MDAEPGSPAPPADEEELLPIRTGWVRRRLRVPELERLLGGPIGARIADNFDSLKVRLDKAVDRLAEAARTAGEEIRRKAAYYRLALLVSAVLGVVAVTAAALLPAFRLPAMAVAAAELVAVTAFGILQKRLARDLIAVSGWAERYQAPLSEARTPEDLQRLAGRIREEAREAIGEEAAAGPAAE
jgi:hypothetical protein